MDMLILPISVHCRWNCLKWIIVMNRYCYYAGHWIPLKIIFRAFYCYGSMCLNYTSSIYVIFFEHFKQKKKAIERCGHNKIKICKRNKKSSCRSDSELRYTFTTYWRHCTEKNWLKSWVSQSSCNSQFPLITEGNLNSHARHTVSRPYGACNIHPHNQEIHPCNP